MSGGDDGARALMRVCLQRVASGPAHSKDLTREQARAATRAILEGRVDPVQAGVFFVALRMKYESEDESNGVLEALREAAGGARAEVEELIDLADPFDGFARTLPASPFLPAVLAACGIPALSHGAETMGPKHGLTHRQVLRAAGVSVDLTPREAAARLGDAGIGWAYLDQSRSCPALHALAPLRDLIVKRPVLSTVERTIGPVRARGRTHLVSGYVHPRYPEIYAGLARHAGFDSALLVRGVEGGVAPSLCQPIRLHRYRKESGRCEAETLPPGDAGVHQTLRAPPLPPALEEGREAPGALAGAAVAAGLAALSGVPGAARDALVLTGALCLQQVCSELGLARAAERVREALDGGEARARFEAAACPANAGRRAVG